MTHRSDDGPTIVKKACCCDEKPSAQPEPAPDRLASESACCGGKPAQEHQAETDRAHSVRGHHGCCGSELGQPDVVSDAPPPRLDR